MFWGALYAGKRMLPLEGIARRFLGNFRSGLDLVVVMGFIVFVGLFVLSFLICCDVLCTLWDNLVV